MLYNDSLWSDIVPICVHINAVDCTKKSIILKNTSMISIDTIHTGTSGSDRYQRRYQKINIWKLYTHTPSPVLSILLAVLIVSPNRQYLGIVVPTTPATHGPVFTPARIRSGTSGWWGTVAPSKLLMRARDMSAISEAWRLPGDKSNYTFRLVQLMFPFLMFLLDNT